MTTGTGSMLRWGHHMTTYYTISMVGMRSPCALSSFKSSSQKLIVPCNALPARVERLYEHSSLYRFWTYTYCSAQITSNTQDTLQFYRPSIRKSPPPPSSRNLNYRPLIPPLSHNKIIKQTKNQHPPNNRNAIIHLGRRRPIDRRPAAEKQDNDQIHTRKHIHRCS